MIQLRPSFMPSVITGVAFITIAESSFRKHGSKLLELRYPLKFMLKRIPNQTTAFIDCHKPFAEILRRYLRLRLHIRQT